MCTAHIFCGREFWVKVVCHKFGFILGLLLWKKIEKRRLIENAGTSVEVPAELKQQKVVSPQIGIADV
jgi:hypothetical protein